MMILGGLFGCMLAIAIVLGFTIENTFICFLIGFSLGGFGTLIGGLYGRK